MTLAPIRCIAQCDVQLETLYSRKLCVACRLICTVAQHIHVPLPSKQCTVIISSLQEVRVFMPWRKPSSS